MKPAPEQKPEQASKDPPKKNIVKSDPVAAGRLGGLKGGPIGGKRSKGGGRPKTYKTEKQRRAARVRAQQEYRKRKAEEAEKPP